MIGVVVFALGAVLIGQAFASRGAKNVGRPHVTFGEGFDRVMGPVSAVELPERPVVALELTAPVAGTAWNPVPSLTQPVAAAVDEDAQAKGAITAGAEIAEPMLGGKVRSRVRVSLPRLRLPRFRFGTDARRANAHATETVQEAVATIEIGHASQIEPMPLAGAHFPALEFVADAPVDADFSPVVSAVQQQADVAAPRAADEAAEPVRAHVATPAVEHVEPGEDDRIAQLLLAGLAQPADVAPAHSLQPTQAKRSPSMSFAGRILSLFAPRRRSAPPVFDATLAAWEEPEDVASTEAPPAAIRHDARAASSPSDGQLAGTAKSEPVVAGATVAGEFGNAGSDAVAATHEVNPDVEETTDEFGISRARLAELAQATIELIPLHGEPTASVAPEIVEDTAAQQSEQVEQSMRMAQEAAAAAARSEQEQCSRWAAELVGRTGVVPLAERRKLLEFYLADPADPESREILSSVIAEDPELAPLAQSAMAEAA